MPVDWVWLVWPTFPTQSTKANYRTVGGDTIYKMDLLKSFDPGLDLDLDPDPGPDVLGPAPYQSPGLAGRHGTSPALLGNRMPHHTSFTSSTPDLRLS